MKTKTKTQRQQQQQRRIHAIRKVVEEIRYCQFILEQAESKTPETKDVAGRLKKLSNEAIGLYLNAETNTIDEHLKVLKFFQDLL